MAHVRQSAQLPSLKTLTFDGNVLPNDSESTNNLEKRIISRMSSEKQMRNQVLLVERSAMGKQSMFAILSNELRRRLEVLDSNLPQSEKVEIVNKFVQQLVNSEFKWK